MNILCRAGFHRPRAGSRANAGYRFSTCERCGRDLVCAAAGRWHVPRGYRVVWKTRAEAASYILLNGPGGGMPGGARPELPIQEVLRLLQDYDFVADQPPREPPGEPIEVRTAEALARFDRADFMAPQPADGGPAPRRSVFPVGSDDTPTTPADKRCTRNP